MPASPSRILLARILLVENDPSVRMSMSLVLVEFGYTVQLAEDGFSALCSIRQEMPDILLTDLNMPGMSGFDLLLVVRQQFPALRTIAMSGAYSGSNIPVGVASDAFYPKGSGVKELLEALQIVGQSEHDWPKAEDRVTHFEIPTSENYSFQETYVPITCPECLQKFPQGLIGSTDPARALKCPHIPAQI